MVGEGNSKTQEDLRTKTRARRNVNDMTLTLAFWQTGSGMQEVRLLDASGLQPPKQNCVYVAPDVGRHVSTSLYMADIFCQSGSRILTLPVPQKPNSPAGEESRGHRHAP